MDSPPALPTPQSPTGISKIKAPSSEALANGPSLDTVMTPDGRLITAITPSPASSRPTTPEPGQTPNTPPKNATRHTRRHARKSSFRSRTSPLDWETLTREDNPMRGFFMLFWMAMAAYMSSAFYQNWKIEGTPLRLRLMSSLSLDSGGLVLSDMALVGSMFVCVIIQKLLAWGWIPLSFSLPLHHIWQSTWFATAVVWVFYKDWPWVQSGFFVLHSMSMLMKQHSYMSSNNELHHKRRRLLKFQQKMDEIAGEMKKLDDADQSGLEVLELEWKYAHANAEELQIELRKGGTTFPNNITFLNFADYLLVPTLVYELEYPRTDRIRPLYILEKFLGTLGTFMILYVTIEHSINPVLEQIPVMGFFDSLTQLLVPFMICYMLFFYIIFECICNGFAELSRFADREFYEDWWNSATFDEYARKWNKPVHEFLLRHVYLEGVTTYKLSRQNATFLTFFLSSCLHELVMIVIGKKFRLYLFLMQMFQIPLIFVTRFLATKKRHRTAGNAFFWFGMFLGPPLLGVAYCREHFKV
ncbi:hypothetical protein HK097_002080 [Rhizophlyctis rosea]|uniref:O-acyltransferase n=1 Tax=Rhizophlyctis rosea TaxID=64517 RepID=A0AAD5WYL5_9FUNG|nr:hypothetical protein HK097_002080 [Rhizophlyctis rosea]